MILQETPAPAAPVVDEVPDQQPEPIVIEPAFSQPQISEAVEKVVTEEPVEEVNQGCGLEDRGCCDIGQEQRVWRDFAW